MSKVNTQQRSTRSRGFRRGRRSLPSRERNSLVSTLRDRDREIRDKDREIAALKQERIVNKETLVKVQSQLDEIRMICKEQTQWHCLQMEALNRENESMGLQIAELNEGLSAEPMISDYSKAIKEAPTKLDRSYVTSLQAQLCKAIHKVEVMSRQLETVGRNYDNMADNMRDDLAEITETKSRMEAELMRRIEEISTEKHAIEEGHKVQLELREAEFGRLESTVEELREELRVVNDERTADVDERVNVMAMTMKALEAQVDGLTQEKASIKRSFQKELNSKNDTISMLEEINATNEQIMEQMMNAERKSIVHDVKPVRGLDSSSSSLRSLVSLDVVKEEEEDEGYEDDTATVFSSIMDTISAMTTKLEDDVMTSLERKQHVIADLDDKDRFGQQQDDEMTHSTLSSSAGSTVDSRYKSAVARTSAPPREIWTPTTHRRKRSFR